MRSLAQVVYTDDADAFVSWTVADSEGQNVDWANPQIAVGSAAYGTASWEGVASPTREIRLAMPSGLGLPAGRHSAYLKVPTGSDFLLGTVTVLDRT